MKLFGDNDNIVLQHLLHQTDVSSVGTDLGVVTTDHSNSAADNTGVDALDQGLGGAELVYLGVGNGIQNLLDGLDGVTDSCLLLLIGDIHQVLITVGEVLDGHLDDCLCVLTGSFSMELDEFGVGHPGDGGGGDELGVEALAQGAQCGEDALHVHNDGYQKLYRLDEEE